MKANFINREVNTVSMTMEITPEEFESALNKVYRENKHRFNVPGFRKGKATRKMIENFYGKGVFNEQALNDVFNDYYSEALDELGFEPVDHPEIDIEGQDLNAGNGVVFNIKFLASPELTVENYKGVKVKVPATEVTEKDLEDQLKSYAQRNARLITVDRAAEMGDTVILDYAGYDYQGEQFEGGSAENYKLKLGSNQFIDTFEEQLIGAMAGDERTVSVTFPIDYPAEKLAGELVDFECKIHEVKEEELPPIDDDLAKECSEFDTLDEWKEELKVKLAENKKQQTENRVKNEVMEQIYQNTVVDMPEVMIEHEIDTLLRQFDQQLGYSGMNLEQYINETQTEMSEFREQIRDEAEKKVKTRIIVEAIAKQEGFTASEEEIEEEFRKMGVQYGLTAERMREMAGDDIRFIKKDICARKAMDFLAESAEVEETDFAFESAEEAAEEGVSEEA